MTQVIAVDWSGRATGEAEAIWLARVVNGRLEELENGLNRDGVINRVIKHARGERRTVVGLDFAFSFPRWYCEQQGWTRGIEVWHAMHERGEDLLKACEPPFWGLKGTKAATLNDRFRETDKAAGNPKSVFQISGGGAVGTGSLRGMPHLATLSKAGFTIWPFDPPGWPRAVEIYPRTLTGPVVKRRHRDRRKYLKERCHEQGAVLRERAAGSEDAFDAAVSALEMSRHLDEFERLPELPPDVSQRIEGQIWMPAREG
jgi:hypothetical protein